MLSVFHTKVCRPLAAAPLSEAKLNYHKLNHPEQTSVKCASKYNIYSQETQLRFDFNVLRRIGAHPRD